MASYKLSGDVRGEALDLYLSGDAPRFRLDELVCEPFAASVAGSECTAARLAVADLRNQDDGRVITARAVSLTGLDVRRAGLAITAESLRLPRGLRYDRHDSQLTVPELVAEGLAVTIDPLVPASGPRPDAENDGADPPPAPSGRASRANRPSPGKARKRRYALLDAVNGHIDVDLYMDVSIPILGRRDETHEFRIPVCDGTIDYDEFENDINWLARSVLDIEVIDGKLALEKDLPLIPFDNKVLLSWPLDPDELVLARKDRVKLRTLLDWELPPKDPDDCESHLALHQIATRNVDIALELDSGAQLDLGDHGRITFGRDGAPGVQGVTITGELQHATAKALPGTALRGALAAVHAAIDGCLVGAAKISAEAIHVEDVRDVTLTFDSFRPGRLTGAIGRIAIGGLVAKTPTDSGPRR